MLQPDTAAIYPEPARISTPCSSFGFTVRRIFNRASPTHDFIQPLSPLSPLTSPLSTRQRKIRPNQLSELPDRAGNVLAKLLHELRRLQQPLRRHRIPP